MLTTRNNDIGATPGSRINLLTSAWRMGSARPPGLSGVIDQVRLRWRLRRLLNGMFWALTLAMGLLMVSTWALNHWHFSSAAVWIFRGLTIFALLGLLYRFCLQPLQRRVGDAQVALYLEEHEPGLGSIVLSAVDARQSTARNLSAPLVEGLVERALDACARIRYGYAIEQAGLREALLRLGLALLVMLGLFTWPPEFLRLGAPALLMPWTSASEYSPYRIELTPGNIEIARGSDQLISADITGYDGDDVLLFTSVDKAVSWRQTSMASANSAGRYESFLFDLHHDLDYFVEAVGRQSPTYRLTVADIPAIAEIGLRYHFPDYTMLEPETSTGSGDITALRGTRVEVIITPTIDIPGGELVLDHGQRVDLRHSGDKTWSGEIVVERNSAYRVRLQRSSGIPVDASSEFRITVLDDKHPNVSISSPGRDTKVSMIEEPLLRVRANDDQGIARLELMLSVNGGDEKVVKLLREVPGPAANKQVEAEHIVYLEDLDLRPGDLISYYVKAEDRAAENQARTATSDIFFYQVRPFSINYLQAEQQGGGGGGAQRDQQHGHLADQQKQFVVATFKMIRDRDRYSEQAWLENLELLASAESRIRDRVEAIVRRIGIRAIIGLDKNYKVIIRELPLAAEAMIEVEKKLRQTQIEDALSDAQVALHHLQRADAVFRNINVALRNRGGAGNNAGFEDLANLFRLEMDKLRHQYETVQHGQQQPAEQVIDETLERLRELARRQQQEVERQLRRRQQAGNNGADSKQAALAEELEAMARQLERLTREQQNSRLQQSISQMHNAAEAMRRAAANTAGGGNIDQARRATEKLRQAQRLLDQSRVQQFSEAVERSLRRAELVEKKQASIQQEVTELEPEWGQKLKSQLKRLDERKQALSADLADLVSDLSHLTTDAGDQQPQAGRSLKQAIRASREHRLHDRIGRTRIMVQLGEKQHAIDNETNIQQGIEKIREHIEAALGQVGEPGNRGIERSLEQMRALARALQFLRERATNRGTGAGNPGQAGNDGDGMMRRELENIVERSGELGRRLLAQGVASGDIDPVLDKINALTQTQLSGGTAAHDLALRALMELEFKLRNQQGEPEIPQFLISESTELPPDYQQMVADYFRNLSRP